jgi:hypothetical protein
METSIRLYQSKAFTPPENDCQWNQCRSVPAITSVIDYSKAFFGAAPKEKHLKNFIAQERCEIVFCVLEGEDERKTYIMPLAAYRDSFMVTTSLSLLSLQ